MRNDDDYDEDDKVPLKCSNINKWSHPLYLHFYTVLFNPMS